MAFVSRIIHGDGTEQLSVLHDGADAERIWPKLVQRATQLVAEEYRTLLLKLYEVPGNDEAAAKAAVMAGEAKEVKWVRVKSPKTLHSKVVEGGPGAVTAKTLAKAAKVLEAKGEDYLQWVRKDLDGLDATLADLQASIAAGDGRESAVLEKLYKQSYKIRGQGGTFGYALMTALGHHLCRLLDSLDAQTPKKIEAIRVHVDAMRMVVARKVTGGGGDLGDTLLKNLASVLDKIAADNGDEGQA